MTETGGTGTGPHTDPDPDPDTTDTTELDGVDRSDATHPTDPAPRLRWWYEIAFVVVFYLIYTAVRNTFGSYGSAANGEINPLAVKHALGHANDIIHIERSMGLFVEPHLQRWYLGLPHHGFIRAWNIYYGTFHFIVPIVALVWLFRRDPVNYPKWRNTLAATTGLALIGFAGYSLMPPRLLDFAGPYGACNPAYGLACEPHGFVDTLARYGGLWSFGSGAMADISNQYAAMPSLHIAWSTWCAIVLVPRVRRRWVKALCVLYPIATLWCILVTANHYWLDAIGGLVTLAVGLAVGFGIDRVARRVRRRLRSRERLGAAPTAPDTSSSVPTRP